MPSQSFHALISTFCGLAGYVWPGSAPLAGALGTDSRRTRPGDALFIPLATIAQRWATRPGR
jgi:hypothetical protein